MVVSEGVVPSSPSTDPGHRSATPVAVAVLWAFNAAQGKLAPPPLLFCRHPPPGPISRWGRGPTMSRVLPRGALSMHGRDPGPPPRGVRDFHALPDLLMCTPALRPGGPGPSHAIATTGTLQDGRRHLHGTKDENPGRQRHAPPSHSTLSTVFDHCTPRFKGERRLPRPYTHVHRPSLPL